MQKIIDNGTTVLIVDEGMMLSNGSTFGKIVRLGKADSADNWHEITEAEAQDKMDAMEEIT